MSGRLISNPQSHANNNLSPIMTAMGDNGLGINNGISKGHDNNFLLE